MVQLINAFPTDWRNRQASHIAALREEFPDAGIYALIEGVHNEACYPMLKRSARLPFYALYSDTPGADEETLCVSPLLVQYSESARSTWNALIQKINGQPAFSLIVTPESLHELAERLIPWCIVDAAGHTLALSFADTRILPQLFSVLSPRQQQQFCGPALRWEYVTRTAEWTSLPLPESDLPPAPEVVLDEHQCAQLITAAEVDNVLFQLRANDADAVDCHTPARAYELVHFWLNCANHAQIQALPDRASLCEMGLRHPGLERHPEIAEWLAGPRQAQTIGSLRARWIGIQVA